MFGCDKFINQSSNLPEIENTNEQVFSEETAYQMVSILRGAVERGTAKKLKMLKSTFSWQNRNHK